MSKVVHLQGRQVLERTEEDESTNFSYLSIIEKTDNVPLNYESLPNFQNNVIYLKSHDGAFKTGFVMKFTIDLMVKHAKSLFEQVFQLQDNCLRFKSSNFEERNKGVDELAQFLRKEQIFDCLKGWRNERYVMYDLKKQPYVLVERALTNIFGIITYGIHINGAVIDENNHINFWIPKRAATKQTWPLKYDNIIAGGLGYPYGIQETMLKECMEEGNLSEELALKYTKPAGCVSYLYHSGEFESDCFQSEGSSITGEVEYIYDMFLPPDVTPTPNDGEVESFKLYSLQETLDLLRSNDFKPNCALIFVDFFIRHGYITPENEPNYAEIVRKMHRTLPFPTM
ncbi:hypothetical protein ACO0QE_001779 [Hanseniaspora vineae]